MLEGHNFIDDHARAEQIAHGRTILPGNPDKPGDGRKDPSKNTFQVRWEPRNPAVDSTHDPIDQIKQGDERDEHGADIEREMQAVHRASRNGAEKIRFLFHFWHFHAARGERLLGFRHKHFRHQQSARRGHDHRGQKMLRFDAEGDVRGHDAARDVRHAAGHDHHQFGLRKFIEKGADGQRSFGLPHEDAGGDVQGFRAARAHHARHDPRGAANDELHYADMIEQRKKSSDENNRRQNLKSEYEVLRRILNAQFAKNKLRTVERVAQKQIDVVASDLKYFPAQIKTQNEKSERDLQAKSPENRLKTDGFSIRGE